MSLLKSLYQKNVGVKLVNLELFELLPYSLYFEGIVFQVIADNSLDLISLNAFLLAGEQNPKEKYYGGYSHF